MLCMANIFGGRESLPLWPNLLRMRLAPHRGWHSERTYTNYYRRFPGDYARDTQHLTTLEHGIYTLLLDHLYSTEKPIASLQDAFRISKCTSGVHRAYCKRVISMFFSEEPTGFTNKRFKEELIHLESRRNAAIENGRKGGRPKPSGLADRNPRESSPDSRLQTPETTSNTTTKDNPAPDGAPGIVPIHVWLSFAEMRRKLRKPLSDHAGELIRQKLEAFSADGEDPVAILEQSIMNGWSGVFSLKGRSNGESFNERNSRKSAEAISKVRSSAERILREVEGNVPELRSKRLSDGGIR